MNIKYLLLALFVFLLCGCAGNDNSLGAWRGETPFTGSWRGTWSTPGSEGKAYSGTLTFSVAKNSEITGSLVDGNSQSGVVTGNVFIDGRYQLQAKFTDGSASELKGVMTLSSTTSIKGDGTRTTGTTGLPFAFDVTPNSGGATTSAFKGSWRGAWSTPGSDGTTASGTLTLTIADTAEITGSIVDGDSKAGTLAGSVDDSGLYQIRATFYDGSGSDLSGVVRLVGTNLQSDGTRSVSGGSLPFKFDVSPSTTAGFRGSWAGTWATQGSSDPSGNGNVRMTISASGVIYGSLDNGLGKTATLLGNVVQDGRFHFTVSFDDASSFEMNGILGEFIDYSFDPSKNGISGDGVRTSGGVNTPFRIRMLSSQTP